MGREVGTNLFGTPRGSFPQIPRPRLVRWDARPGPDSIPDDGGNAMVSETRLGNALIAPFGRTCPKMHPSHPHKIGCVTLRLKAIMSTSMTFWEMT